MVFILFDAVLVTLSLKRSMVGVAQLVEHWIVVPVVVGSKPTVHPTFAPCRELRRGKPTSSGSEGGSDEVLEEDEVELASAIRLR
jgi:hypothetical protein